MPIDVEQVGFRIEMIVTAYNGDGSRVVACMVGGYGFGGWLECDGFRRGVGCDDGFWVWVVHSGTSAEVLGGGFGDRPTTVPAGRSPLSGFSSLFFSFWNLGKELDREREREGFARVFFSMGTVWLQFQLGELSAWRLCE